MVGVNLCEIFWKPKPKKEKDLSIMFGGFFSKKDKKNSTKGVCPSLHSLCTLSKVKGVSYHLRMLRVLSDFFFSESFYVIIDLSNSLSLSIYLSL